MVSEELFQDNLERFSRMCPLAALRVPDLEVNHLQFCQTVKRELNLKRLEEDKELYYHASEGAVAEAQNWVERLCPLGIKVIFLYGLGLGYYCDALQEWLKRDAGRFLIVLEDDLGVVRRFLETEKAANILSNNQIILQYFPTPGEHEWGKFRKQFKWCFYGFARSPYRFSASHFYQQERAVTSSLIQKQIEMNLKQIASEKYDIFNNHKTIFRNFYACMLSLGLTYFAPSLFRKFTHIPALICGAGPSLIKQLPALRELEDRALIFGSGSGLNVLNRHGIQPHFGIGVDPTDAQESRFMTNTAYETPIFCTARFSSGAFNIIHGPRLYLPGFVYFNIADWFNRELQLPKSSAREFTSTSILCASIATAFRDNPIILTGIDMAYTESTHYAPGVMAHPTDDRSHHQAISSIPEKAIPGINVEGSSVMTHWDWVRQAGAYTGLSKDYPEITFINATEGGLKILEVPHLPLSNVREKYLTQAYDLHNWVHTEIELSKLPFVTEERAIASMEKWASSLQRCVEQISHILDELQQFSSRLQDEAALPPEVMTGRMVLIQEEMKEEPAYEFFLVSFSKIFELFYGVYLLKLRFFPDQYRGKRRLEVQLQFEKARYQYFHKYATTHLGLIQEMVQSYRQRQEQLKQYKAIAPHFDLAEKDSYLFEAGKLTIIDQELNVAYEGEFQPKRISEERKRAPRTEGAFLTEEEAVWDGESLLFYSDGALKGQLFYRQGKRHGPSTFYSPEGKVLAKSWFWEDRRVGKTWQYYLTGQIYSLQRYREGVRQGRQEYYYPDGTLKTVMAFQDGLLEGEVRLYHPNGQVKRELHFLKGVLHGVEKGFDEKGSLMLEAEYKSGVPVGRSRTWHPNGHLAKEVTFYNNPLNFDLYLWDSSGKLIKKQLSLPDNPLEEMLKKSNELRKSLDKIVEELGED